jgi:hypothetical protein
VSLLDEHKDIFLSAHKEVDEKNERSSTPLTESDITYSSPSKSRIIKSSKITGGHNSAKSNNLVMSLSSSTGGESETSEEEQNHHLI